MEVVPEVGKPDGILKWNRYVKSLIQIYLARFNEIIYNSDGNKKETAC